MEGAPDWGLQGNPHPGECFANRVWRAHSLGWSSSSTSSVAGVLVAQAISGNNATTDVRPLKLCWGTYIGRYTWEGSGREGTRTEPLLFCSSQGLWGVTAWGAGLSWDNGSGLQAPSPSPAGNGVESAGGWQESQELPATATVLC